MAAFWDASESTLKPSSDGPVQRPISVAEIQDLRARRAWLEPRFAKGGGHERPNPRVEDALSRGFFLASYAAAI